MSKAQTPLQEIQEQMRQMKADKAAMLEEIHRKRTDASTRREAAELAKAAATEALDAEAYEKAKAEYARAAAALEMLDTRAEQIQRKKLITEAESDKVIDLLLTYEDSLAAKFKADMAEHLRQLAKLRENYMAEIRETEATITEWSRDIFHNYRDFAGGSRIDPETGKRTNRMERPQPVHIIPYVGCAEARALGEYLEKTAPLYK